MNIIDLLKRQHEEVRDVLERMIAEDDKKESRTLMSQLGRALRLHMIIEEKIVYPAASRAFEGDEDDEETVLEAYEEHAVTRYCLEALEGTQPSDRRFVVRAKMVQELFERHVEEEENDMFPELEGKLGRDGIERLGVQVERRVEQLEAEVVEGGTGRARRSSGQRSQKAAGSRASRASRGSRASPASRGSRVGRSTASGGGRRSGSRGTTRRASSGSTGGARSRENNGRKPRRGESTSRS